MAVKELGGAPEAAVFVDVFQKIIAAIAALGVYKSLLKFLFPATTTSYETSDFRFELLPVRKMVRLTVKTVVSVLLSAGMIVVLVHAVPMIPAIIAMPFSWQQAGIAVALAVMAVLSVVLPLSAVHVDPAYKQWMMLSPTKTIYTHRLAAMVKDDGSEPAAQVSPPAAPGEKEMMMAAENVFSVALGAHIIDSDRNRDLLYNVVPFLRASRRDVDSAVAELLDKARGKSDDEKK